MPTSREKRYFRRKSLQWWITHFKKQDTEPSASEMKAFTSGFNMGWEAHKKKITPQKRHKNYEERIISEVGK